MCCDGTLFTNAPLVDPDLEGARELGLAVYTTQEGDTDYEAFHLPCHLHDGKCTIYGQWRPSICGDYKCRLLDAVVDGSRSVADCMAVVAEARSLAEELEEARKGDSEPGEDSAEAPVLLAAAAFESLMVRYFRRPSSDHESS
jgi:hypothetical protein